MAELISPMERLVNYMMIFSFMIDAFGFGVLIWMVGQRGDEPRGR